MAAAALLLVLLLYGTVVMGFTRFPMYLSHFQRRLPIHDEEKIRPWNKRGWPHPRWPRWYGWLQYVLLAFTVARMAVDGHDYRLDGATCDPEAVLGLHRSIRFLALLQSPWKVGMYASLSLAIWKFCQLLDRRAGEQKKTRSQAVLRNVTLYGSTLLLDCVITSLMDCPTEPWISSMTIREQVDVLSTKWRHYHARQFVLVRLSHAMTYLPVLLCLTRQTAVDFAKWRIFMLFVPDVVADWAHFVDAPAVACERLRFEAEDLCQGVDRHFVRTFVSFPMNWLFLSTSS